MLAVGISGLLARSLDPGNPHARSPSTHAADARHAGRTVDLEPKPFQTPPMGEPARHLPEHPDDPPGEDISAEQWQASWNDELARRIAEIERGDAKLLDGDEVMAKMRALIARSPAP